MYEIRLFKIIQYMCIYGITHKQSHHKHSVQYINN